MAFDFSDFVVAIGETYLEARNKKMDDPLEVIFTGFKKTKRMIDEAYEKDRVEFYEQRKQSSWDL
jgi:hypothetical protein